MDPISPVASVLAIATAAAQIARAISRLRAFGQMPGRVLALKNEVTDLEVVLRQVGQLLQQKSTLPTTEQESLKQILARANNLLTKLALALERLANACAGSKIKVVTRSTIWYREKELFQGFQADIRAVKANLNLVFGVSSSHDLEQIILELRRVSILSSDAKETGERYSKSVTQALADQHNALNSRMDLQYQGLADRLDTLGRILSSENPQGEKSSDIGIVSEKGTDESPNTETLRILVSHRVPCRRWCPCSCHAKRKANVTMAGVMEHLLGKVFVGYTGMPVINKPCDFRGCIDRQKLAVTMEYWFPWWFISKNLRLYVKCLPGTGPQFQMSTIRRVPDTSQSITYAMQGNIEGLQYLFSRGLARPSDVSDSRGFSLMRWALYGGMYQYETVQFLISQGATVDEISYENVWDFMFRNKCNETEARALRCITDGGDRDWVEEQNFPLAHRIIFGLTSKSLALEVEENPNAVYVTDAQGRTALDWATSRAQLDDIRVLLSAGADPNNMDITGRITVHHAMDSDSVPCLRLILEGGGNPNPIFPTGTFRSTALTAAARLGNREMIKTLLQFDADPNACNPEGVTPLSNAAKFSTAECALVLLEYGANLNAIASNGMTPLTTAIVHNNHAVLRLFVDRCYEFIMTARLKGPQLLSIIAEHADISTMAILASIQPLKISYDLSVDLVAAGKVILQQRRDYDEKLSEAFEELVTIAQAGEAEAGSTDSALESGLFFSAQSSFHAELAEALSALNSPHGSDPDGFVDRDSDQTDDHSDEKSTLVPKRASTV